MSNHFCVGNSVELAMFSTIVVENILSNIVFMIRVNIVVVDLINTCLSIEKVLEDEGFFHQLYVISNGVVANKAVNCIIKIENFLHSFIVSKKAETI